MSQILSFLEKSIFQLELISADRSRRSRRGKKERRRGQGKKREGKRKEKELRRDKGQIWKIVRSGGEEREEKEESSRRQVDKTG